MKTSHVLAFLAVVLVVALGAGTASGQAPAERAATPRRIPEIVLIDMGKLFKESVRFKQYMAELQAEMEKADGELKGERDAIRKLMDQLKEIKTGSPQYQEKDDQITVRKTRLTVEVERQRKDFAKREAKIWYAVYQRIQAAVEAYAKSYGIAVVLKFNSDVPDVENPEAVMRELQKPVLYYHEALDITGIIQRMLEQEVERSTQNPSRTGGLPPPQSR